MVQDNVVIITGDIHTHWAAEVVEQACKNQPDYGGYEETGADLPNAQRPTCVPCDTPQLPAVWCPMSCRLLSPGIRAVLR